MTAGIYISLTALFKYTHTYHTYFNLPFIIHFLERLFVIFYLPLQALSFRYLLFFYIFELRSFLVDYNLFFFFIIFHSSKILISKRYNVCFLIWSLFRLLKFVLKLSLIAHYLYLLLVYSLFWWFWRDLLSNLEVLWLLWSNH